MEPDGHEGAQRSSLTRALARVDQANLPAIQPPTGPHRDASIDFHFTHQATLPIEDVATLVGHLHWRQFGELLWRNSRAGLFRQRLSETPQRNRIVARRRF